MNTGMTGVAISTTGHEHRMGFLETCVRMWDYCLPQGASLFVTVDGSEEDAQRVRAALAEWTRSVFRVGQRTGYPSDHTDRHRLGVAVNKNTGLELLMDNTRAEHLFLCDDDTWPLYHHALTKHMNFKHSLVGWGQSRLDYTEGDYVAWNWPRGVMLYAHREVVHTVGGMDERFGIGGHEHVEWSNRIYNAGLTPAPFISPASYATRKATGAKVLWHAEDMPREGEVGGQWTARKRRNTTIDPSVRDWEQVAKIMDAREGSADFVPYRAHENGRTSATLCQDLSGQGRCAMEPAEPRSET